MAQSNLSIALHNRAFQMDGARFIMKNRTGAITDEPGLGKTIQSIAAVVGSKTTGSVLVVAPKSAAYLTWPGELRRWLSDLAPDDPVNILGGNLNATERKLLLRNVIRWEIAHQKGEQPGRQWLVVSPNYLRFKYQLDDDGKFVYGDDSEKVLLPVREALKPLLAIPWGAIIVDEAHETLSGSTGNVKKMSGQSLGLRLLKVKEGGLRIALTGTPFRGQHQNLWGLANWCRPDLYPDGNHGGEGTLPYWRWIHKHFDSYHDDVFDREIIGPLRSEERLAQECKTWMIRRTKKIVAPDLPDKLYGGTPFNPRKPASDKDNPVAVWLPMTGKQATLYEQMKKETIADLDNGVLLANSLLAKITRLKQFANSVGVLDDKGNFQPSLPSNKFDWLLQFLRERGFDEPGAETGKIVVASQFTRHINLFAAELRDKYGMKCHVITGQTPPEKRRIYVEDFQSESSSASLMLLNTKAGGVGITLDAADDMVVVDSTSNVDDQVQLEDRIHRISRVHSVTIWNLVSKGTVDQQILRTTRKTGRSIKRILDTPENAMSLLQS